MTTSVRYGALLGLIVLTGLVAWFIAAPGTPDPTGTVDYTVEAREQVPDLGTVGQVLVPDLALGDGCRGGPPHEHPRRCRARRAADRIPRTTHPRGVHGRRGDLSLGGFGSVLHNG